MLLTHSRFDRTASNLPQFLLRAGCPPRLLNAGAALSETSGLKNPINPSAGTTSLNSIAESLAETVAAPIPKPTAVSAAPTHHCCAKCRKTAGLRRTETHCPRCRLAMRLAELLLGKLSPAVWERMRRIFCLPKNPKQLLPDKARAVCRILESFVERVPITEQAILTEAELLKLILELPNLPAPLAQIGRGRNKAQTAQDGSRRNHGNGYNVGNNTDDDGASATTSGDQTKTAAVTTAATAAQRQPISTALFRKVAVRQGLHCWWCGIPLVRESRIPLSKRMLKKDGTILHYARGELREAAVATIDHLVRVADDGDNRPENLVISCYPCNGERERITTLHVRSFARKRTACRSCGGRFFHPDWGCCSICGTAPERLEKFSNRRRGFGKLFNLIERLKHFVFKDRQSPVE